MTKYYVEEIKNKAQLKINDTMFIQRKFISITFIGLATLVGYALLYQSSNAGLGKTDLTNTPACKQLQGYCIANQAPDGMIELPGKTPYWNSRVELDEKGLPFNRDPENRIYRNVSSIAFRISSRGQEYGLADGCATLPMGKLQQAGLEWLEANAVPLRDAVVWHYNYDTQVNDVLVSAGWPSAFAQAAIINRLLMAACTSHDQKYAELARKAGKALLIPVSEGGVRSNNDDFVWFQEIPIADDHAPFILNAHLYSIFSLLLLDRYFPDEGFRDAAEKGLASLDRALPVIDNGYWNRYDLRPRYPAVTFRLDGAGEKMWSLSLQSGEETSKLDLSTGEKWPKRNSLWGNISRSGDGKSVLLGKKVYAQFVLPIGRTFQPDLLSSSSKLTVTLECCEKELKVYGFGFRPELTEYFQLREIGRKKQGNLEIISFETGLNDYAWGQVAQEYIPFHSELMYLISRLASRPDYLTYAYRWENFHRNWLRDKEGSSQQEALRRRYPLGSTAELGLALKEKFGNRSPRTVGEEDLGEFIQDTVIASIGSACGRSESSKACDLTRSISDSLALDQ